MSTTNSDDTARKERNAKLSTILGIEWPPSNGGNDQMTLPEQIELLEDALLRVDAEKSASPKRGTTTTTTTTTAAAAAALARANASFTPGPDAKATPAANLAPKAETGKSTPATKPITGWQRTVAAIRVEK